MTIQEVVAIGGPGLAFVVFLVMTNILHPTKQCDEHIAAIKDGKDAIIAEIKRQRDDIIAERDMLRGQFMRQTRSIQEATSAVKGDGS